MLFLSPRKPACGEFQRRRNERGTYKRSIGVTGRRQRALNGSLGTLTNVWRFEDRDECVNDGEAIAGSAIERAAHVCRNMSGYGGADGGDRSR